MFIYYNGVYHNFAVCHSLSVGMQYLDMHSSYMFYICANSKHRISRMFDNEEDAKEELSALITRINQPADSPLNTIIKGETK